MYKSIFIFISLLFLITNSSLAANIECKNEDPNVSITEDIKHSEVVAIVQLEEGKVEGNWGIRIRNADIKKEVVLSKRMNTRYDLQLRGKLIEKLKGEPQLVQDKERAVRKDAGQINIIDTGLEIKFNILMKYIGICRNGVVISDSGERVDDLPPLIVGQKYIVLIEKKENSHIYYKNIWPIDSKEAKEILEIFKRKSLNL